MAYVPTFRLLCDNYNPIVCCLQETMLTKDDFIIRGSDLTSLFLLLQCMINHNV